MLQLFFLLIIVPAFLGLFIQSIVRDNNNVNYIFFFSLGFLVEVAEFALVCYPATYLDISFHVVCNTIGGIYVAESLGVLIWLLAIHRFSPNSFFNKDIIIKIMRSPSFWIMMIICGFQIGRLLFLGPSEMRDSKTYCALIVDILQSDHLFRINPESGIPIASILDMDLKYSLSAWYPFIAMLAKFGGLHPLILHNTLLPPYLLVLHYSVLYTLGYLVFKKRHVDTCIFTAFCAFIHEVTLYCHTPTMIKLVWPVWGKGVLSMTVVPVILVFFMLYVKNKSQKRMLSFLVIFLLIVISGCSMSTMAAIVLPLELSILGLVWAIRNRSLTPLVYSVICSIPAVLYVTIYYYLSSLQSIR